MVADGVGRSGSSQDRETQGVPGVAVRRQPRVRRTEWIELWNANAHPVEWTRTADRIIDAVGHYRDRRSGPGH
ncbi:hypothetical protein ABIA38_005574 [Embleya sp. AB8]